MAEPFLGQIMLCGLSYAPVGWADCWGQLLPISQNTALFALLGTSFGGDGRSNFALPDLRGAVAVSTGQRAGGSQYAMGQTAGSETVALLSNQLPPHTHPLQATAGTANAAQATGNSFAKVPLIRTGGLYHAGPADSTLAAGAVMPAGGGTSHNTMQPFLVLRYIIALQGLFPSRS